MATYTIEKLRTTAQEAVFIAGKMDCMDVFQLIPDFAEALRKNVKQPKRQDVHARYSLMCAALWTAGRLHGVREERERRHRAKQ